MCWGHWVVGEMEWGMVWVKRWFLGDVGRAFGGMKERGVGGEGGIDRVELLRELRNIWMKL